MSKFDELKKLAQQATTGPWEFDRAYTPISIQGGEVVGDDELPWGDVSTKEEYELLDDDGEPTTGPLTICPEIGPANGRYIASANPAAILELLAIQAQLVADIKEVLASLQAANDDSDGPITDTIWMRGARNETVFEALENALAAAGAQP